MSAVASPRLRRLAAALALALATAAQAAPIELDLPAQPLANALKQLAQAAGLTLAVDSQLLAGRQAPAVQGRLDGEEALRRLLAGSGLSFSLEGNTVLIRAARPAAQSEPQLPEVRVQAASATPAYQAEIATSATRIKAPLRDIPQTVNVVPAAVIADQGARSMQEVLHNVPGVSFHIGDGQRDQAYIRGFDAIGDQYLDGLRDDGLYYRDLSNIERVEVVKGPAAVLYGRGSSGGVINRITKKPGATPVREVELTAGSFSQRRGTVDVGGSVGEAASFRLAGAVEDSGSFRSQGFLKRENVAPSLALQLASDTRLLLQMEKLSDRRVTDMGIPAFRGRPVDVPVETYYGTANARQDDYSQATVTSGRAALEHKINDHWSVRNLFGSYSYHLDRQNTFGQTVNEAARTVSLFHGQTRRQDDGWFNQFELTQDLAAGGTRHQLLYGLETGRQEKDFQSFDWGTKPSVSLFNPVLPTLAAFGTRTLANNNLTTMDVDSLYVQDLLTLSERWKALVGLRYDVFRQEVQDRKAGQANRARTDREWSPRAGLVFQPADWQAYYLSYSRSFQPSGETLAFTTAQAEMAPEETSNVEVGAKLDLFEGRASATAALFTLERSNIKNTDPVTKAIVAVGTQRTRGAELTLAGEVAPGWQVSAGYAYLDARITQSIAVQNGVRLQGRRAALTPAHSGNLWLMRDLGQGFHLGGGLVYSGDRYASPDNLVSLGGFVTADAVLTYKAKTFDVALNVKNLADKEYFAAGHGASNNLNAPGAPRSIELTGRVRF